MYREDRRYDDRNRDRGERGFQQSTAPVQVGDELDVTIEAVGEKGDGIAKKKGFVLFVPNAKQGERLRIRVTKVLRKVGFADKIGNAAPAKEQLEEAEESGPAQEEQKPSLEDTENFGEEESSGEESEDFSMSDDDENK